jgi:type III secretion system needle length determinant
MNNCDVKFQSSSAASTSFSDADRRSSLKAPDHADTDRFQQLLNEAPDKHGSNSHGQRGMGGDQDADTDIFQRLLGDASDRYATGNGIRTQSTDTEAPLDLSAQDITDPSLMANPLDSLFSGRMVQAAAAPPSAFGFVDIEQLVDHILVSSPENGGHEVRLMLDDKLLADTEIIIQRSLDGLLSVELRTTNISSFQTLVASQADLRRLLEQNESSEVRIVVNQDDAEDGGTDRRSRGFIQEEYPEK